MVDRSGEREMKVFGDPLKIMWGNLILDFVVKTFSESYGVMVTSIIEEREKWLEDVRTTVNSLF